MRKSKGERRKEKLNHKRLMAIVFIVAMLGMILPVIPVSSFTHEMCNAAFQVKVEGESSYIDETGPWGISFEEPTYGFDSTFEVEVWILGVEDMFGYEFELNWNGSEYFYIEDYTVEEIWADQVVVKPDVEYDLYYLGYASTDWYKQAVAALAPSTGVTGDFKLATLTFRIYNDVCWCEEEVAFEFRVENEQASDSCSGEIKLCDDYWELVYFEAVEPDIKMVPDMEIQSVVGEKFTKEIWVSNITKMKSLHFDLFWNKVNQTWHPNDPDGPTKYVDAIEFHDFKFDGALPCLDVDDYELTELTSGWILHVDLVVKCTGPLLNGTFPIGTITFETLDPWACGRQPPYDYEQPHTWKAGYELVYFMFLSGYFDVYCPELAYIFFGADYSDAAPLYSREEVLTEGYNLYAAWHTDGPYSLSDFGSEPVTFTVDENCDEVVFEICAPDGFEKDMYGDGDLIPDYNDTACFAFDIYGNEGGHVWSGYDFQVAYEPGSLRWSGSDTEWMAYSVDGSTWETDEDNVEGVSWSWTDTRLTVTVSIDKLGGAGSKFGYWLRLHDQTGYYGTDLQPDMLLVDIYADAVPLTGCECFTEKWYSEYIWEAFQYPFAELYLFLPVTGDLNGDGVVDITDVMIIASFYGEQAKYGSHGPKNWASSQYPAMYYDLDFDGDVDIFDIVIVTKHFGASA